MTDAIDPRAQLRAHLEFYADLGVTGFSRDTSWTGDRVPDSGDRVPNDATAPQSAGLPPSPSGFGAAGGEPALPPTSATAMACDSLEALRAHIGPQCTRCKLCALGRKQVVFGVGNPSAELMFVGEAPGADEDEQGIPFVGRAGQLLTKIIEAIEMRRDDVYIANVIKCRPPGNRNPEPDEVLVCEPFLFQQIDLIKPKVIVALGKFAAQSLLRTDTPITKLRGRVHAFRGAQLIPTFHPAYLLRSPDKKRETWEDMKLVRSLLREAGSTPAPDAVEGGEAR
jgi:uracil-DNA glycosylase family 4